HVIAMKKTFVLTERQLDCIVHGQHVPLITVIHGPFRSQVERVLNYAGTAAAGKTGGVVNHFGEGVSSADLNASRHPPAYLQDSAVINGVSLRALPHVGDHIWNPRRTQAGAIRSFGNIELGSFDAGVVQIDLEVAA